MISHLGNSYKDRSRLTYLSTDWPIDWLSHWLTGWLTRFLFLSLTRSLTHSFCPSLYFFSSLLVQALPYLGLEDSVDVVYGSSAGKMNAVHINICIYKYIYNKNMFIYLFIYLHALILIFIYVFIYVFIYIECKSNLIFGQVLQSDAKIVTKKWLDKLHSIGYCR